MERLPSATYKVSRYFLQTVSTAAMAIITNNRQGPWRFTRSICHTYTHRPFILHDLFFLPFVQSRASVIYLSYTHGPFILRAFFAPFWTEQSFSVGHGTNYLGGMTDASGTRVSSGAIVGEHLPWCSQLFWKVRSADVFLYRLYPAAIKLSSRRV